MTSVSVSVQQHTQFVLNAAREKRDMEQRHAAVKKKVCFFYKDEHLNTHFYSV